MSELTLEDLNDLRARIFSKEPVTPEEVAQAVEFLRQDRMAAKPAQRAKAAKTNDFDALLDSEE